MKTLSVTLRVKGFCCAQVIEGDEVLLSHTGDVPDGLQREGDSLTLDIDVATGKITDWDAKKFQAWFEKKKKKLRVLRRVGDWLEEHEESDKVGEEMRQCTVHTGCMVALRLAALNKLQLDKLDATGECEL